jgi:glutathione S-transferase
MDEFVVYGIAGSPYGRAVMVTLKEKGQPFRFEPMTPAEFKREPHLSRHCFGKVPVLQHGDFTLYETQAILRYLDRILRHLALSPTDSKALARMDQCLNINDCYLFREVSAVIAFERVVKPRVLGLAADDEAVKASMPRAHQTFGELARLLGHQKYFAGDQYSLADVMLGAHLDLFVEAPEWQTLTGHLPLLLDWHARVVARPSFQETTWDLVTEMSWAA